MVRPLILGLAGWLLVASARANLDLTPKLSQYELDGVKFKQLAFADGSERKETFLVTLSYNLHGGSYSRSILFLNRGSEQIQFQLVCRQADFKELQKAFLDSQYSWQNL